MKMGIKIKPIRSDPKPIPYPLEYAKLCNVRSTHSLGFRLLIGSTSPIPGAFDIQHKTSESIFELV